VLYLPGAVGLPASGAVDFLRFTVLILGLQREFAAGPVAVRGGVGFGWRCGPGLVGIGIDPGMGVAGATADLRTDNTAGGAANQAPRLFLAKVPAAVQANNKKNTDNRLRISKNFVFLLLLFI
jgi:hypothetical protein